MRIVPISQVIQMGDGEIVPSFRGRVNFVGPRNTGEGNYGPWSLQNLTIGGVDGDSGSASVLIKDRDECPANWKGKVILI